MDKSKIGLRGSDECITINFNLSILVSSLGQIKLMSQLAHHAQIVIFGIIADLVVEEHGERTRVGNVYLWMESEDSSWHGATSGLHLTCIMLGFDLGYDGPWQERQALEWENYSISISLTSKMSKIKIDL